MDSISPEVFKVREAPKWIRTGSTWINPNGDLIEQTILPPDTCKTERDWWWALRCWYIEKAPFISADDVSKAYKAFRFKEARCEHCKPVSYTDFLIWKRLGSKRKLLEVKPKGKKKLNKYTRKMYYIEVYWEQD